MNINESNIRKIVGRYPVGDFPPFSNSDTKACNQYARKLCNKIESSKVLEVILEPDSYGSGYASYFDLFITKKDKSFYVQKDGYIEIKGISLYISRLAPIAVFGEGEKAINETDGFASHFLDCSCISSYPVGDWSIELNEVRNFLNIYKYTLLLKKEVLKPLWFSVEIPTILDSEHVFDALFYWED
ncbi:hypothetical protein [Spartinivicinus ruber]|uniref:hypothetical protein n=1 Tax=Spartinivicinus ruber TaxID=2683272 RepID=UPI0013CFC4F3|nr:hypothetical protein [Spartinivicinus ruber]